MKTSLSFLLRLAALVFAATLPPVALAAGESITIGQSLPLTGTAFFNANRVLAGAEAYVAHINTLGGINGRQIKLVTLDDGNDPARYAENFRTLVQTHKVAAVMNCLGDRLCQVAANMAAEHKTPLVGTISGSAAITQRENGFVFSLRPGYGKEAEALARQLGTMGISSVAILSDADEKGEKIAALTTHLANLGVKTSMINFDRKLPDAYEKMMSTLGRGQFQAAILELDADSVNGMVQKGLSSRPEWPPTLAMLSSGNFTHVTRSFQNRVIGFTNVVPNPETSTIPLAREAQKAAERSGGPEAVSFEGFESYIATNVCLEGIRRTASSLTRDGLARALRSMVNYDLGGFFVSFGKNRTGSDWVDIGLRSKNGLYTR